MTTLLERCQRLTAKIEQLTLAQRHANQQRLVQERTREWSGRYNKLKAVQARAAFVQLDAEAERSVAEKRAYLARNAALVLERLKSHEDIDQLTEDASWTRLLASVEGLAEQVEACGRRAWKAQVDEQGALEEPAWLRERAPSTPTNDVAIAAYQLHYGVYAAIAKLAMPRSADDLIRLSEAIAACRAEAAKITFDVPPEVQRFFEAIRSGSATLASLTPGVLDWLAKNAQLERYQIRSAGQ